MMRHNYFTALMKKSRSSTWQRPALTHVLVVAPRRVGHPEGSARHELLDELRAEAEGSRARQGLDCDDSVLLDSRGVSPKDELSRHPVVLCEPVDGEVLLVVLAEVGTLGLGEAAG